jgi:hypothetical protein
MRLPHVRFTVRRMMVAIAGVSLILWGVNLRRHSLRCAYEALCKRATLELFLESRHPVGRPMRAEEVERMKQGAAHFSDLAEKYERAARYPFLPLPRGLPEPPEPPGPFPPG